MERSQNPSAIRSRKMIVDALLRLMERKPYNEISVTDIAKEAQVVRKTFYRHFYTLEDVLDEYVEQLFVEYSSMLKDAQIQNIVEHIPLYFSFWKSHEDFLQVLSKNDLLFLILKKYDQIFPDIFALLPCHMDEDAVIKSYFQSYTAGGFFSLLFQWIKSGYKESPEEMSSIFTKFFAQFIADNQIR